MNRLRLTSLASLLAVLLALVAGCGSIAAAGELTGALAQDGFTNPNVGVATRNGVDIVTVTASGHSSLSGDEALNQAAEITWETFPRHVDVVELTIGPDGGTASRAQLEAAFGPRNPELDARTIGGDFVGPLIGIGVGFLVLIIGVVLLVVLLVRRSRRRRVAAGPPPPGGYPPRGYPPPGAAPPPNIPPPGSSRPAAPPDRSSEAATPPEGVPQVDAPTDAPTDGPADAPAGEREKPPERPSDPTSPTGPAGPDEKPSDDPTRSTP